MSTKAISVTEAARNFADCINRARYQGTTFVLHKNGVPVARIVPEERKSCTGLELAAALRVALKDVHLGEEEATAWLYDLEEARKNLIPAVDKWQS
ncbi:MAG TPA: type II toxin-antitoxin system prevent-host-death family antitoxin [Terracidiphilus sp.]|nr:type II toxin-antitoxin system prevent-host-death family antitoxin [Terracidiphilus sp.]